MQEVHGHDLINLIAEQKVRLSLEQIKALALDKIGTDVVYHTCSNTGMTTDEMITFLLNKGKIADNGAGYQINQGEVCEH